MNASNDDLHKLDRELSEKINSVRREAGKMAEQRRNEAFGVFAGFLILLGILSHFGLRQVAEKMLNDMGGEVIEKHVLRAKENADETSALRREAEYLVGMLEKDDYIMRMKNQSARIMSQEQTIEKLVKFSKRFDAIKFGQLNWPGPDEFGTRLIPTQEGICFLTRVAGGFSGNEDEVEIHQREENGVNYWYLTGNPSQGSVGATAGCLSWPRRVDFKVPPG